MKVFLDIDGVMVHANPHKIVEMEEDGFYKFKPAAVSIVNSIGNVEIILSTSHRFRFSIDEWIEMLKNRGLEFDSISIINLEPSIKISRKDEIEAWISKNQYDYNDIIIIDDDKSLNELSEPLKNRLVLTNSYVGLNNLEELERVIKFVSKRL